MFCDEVKARKSVKKQVKKKEKPNETIKSDRDIIYTCTHTGVDKERTRKPSTETNGQSLCVHTRASEHTLEKERVRERVRR